VGYCAWELVCLWARTMLMLTKKIYHTMMMHNKAMHTDADKPHL